MKPHEDEWRVAQEPYGSGQRVVIRNGSGTVAYFPSFDSRSAAARMPNATLAHAAPDMARALLALKRRLEAQTPGITATHSSDYGALCEALMKAGVLP